MPGPRDDPAGGGCPTGIPQAGLPQAGAWPEGWLRPWWGERQPGPVAVNHTARDWTRIGTVGSPGRALVDLRGLVTPGTDGWSLDWWIGAEDRWHLPSREVAVRQALVDGAPVIETRMRIPGGEAVHRVWAWESPDDGTQLVIEVDNRSAVPFAAAFAIRPYNLEGPSPIGRIEASGRMLMVDGRPGVVFPAPPRQVVLSAGSRGDVLDALQAPLLARVPPGSGSAVVDDPDGWATAAAVVPVAHRTLVRVVVPLAGTRHDPVSPRWRSGWRPTRAVAAPPVPRVPEFTPASLPGGEAVAAGWSSHVAHGIRVEWPGGLLGEAVEAQRRHLALSDLRPTVDRRAIGAGSPGVDDAVVVAALVTAGATAMAAGWLSRWIGAQAGDGSLGTDGAATAAVLWALELHHALGGRLAVDVPALAAAAESVARASAPGRPGPESPAPVAWSVAGLLAAARLLEGHGEGAAAGTAVAWATARLERLRVPGGSAPAGTAAGRARPADGHVLEGLTAVDLGLRPAHDLAPPAWGPPLPGSWHPLTRPAVALLAARVGLRAGHPDALTDLDGLLAVGAPTWRWADQVDPVTGGGVAGDGHAAAAAAGMWAVGRDLLVRDQPPPPGGGAVPEGSSGPTGTGLALCPWFPPAWRGQELEVHGLPTRAGLLSYAIRWHGRRPALLWEVTGLGSDVHLSAPGLDPAWTATGRRGDALLAAAAE
jgi:hypothetical protein